MKENKQSKDKMIPPQEQGSQLDVNFEVNAESEVAARRLFDMACKRLRNVNEWDRICGPLSAVFKLTDGQGNAITRPAEVGDYFMIDVPGPGPAAGEGYDWVHVEAMEDSRNPQGSDESVTLKVRPASSPRNTSPDTAHFFSSDATSSFRVLRSGNVVRAEVHGRNETPNIEAANPGDKVRNAVIGTTAKAGMSAPQWNSLVKGLLKSGE